MRFDDLDARMRVYETAHDHCALPGLFLVVRADGRGFTRLTKELLGLEAPFDVRFRDAMTDVLRHLMDCGLPCLLGYSQSDEISLLLHPDASAFGRKERKLISVVAGEASGVASIALGRPVAFDARVSQLPSARLVVDYFRWRHADAARNALEAHCYWTLRREGMTADAAATRIAGLSTADKNELLFARGINFNELPAWHKRGFAARWATVTVDGVDPHSGAAVVAHRRRLVVDTELPIGDAFAAYVEAALAPPAGAAS
jgi:tRNA(His) guanylyltransferase